MAEEKAARAVYEVDRKKKAIDKADAKRTAAKQADEAVMRPLRQMLLKCC